MSTFNSDRTMSDEEFRLFRDSVNDYCGIHFDSDSKYLLEKRLARRMAELGIQTFREYHRYLADILHRDQELLDIMDVLTVNETYFFREAHQLATLTEEILPELIRSRPETGRHSLRIWSAGCATGEEAYTIAMLLREIPELRGWNLEVIGTDISPRVLRIARQGLYGLSSFRETDERYRERFFEKQDNVYRVNDDLRRCVMFSQLNLYDPKRIALLGRMDLIFCRNVIIYFSLEARKRVVTSLHRTLVEGGFLFLGHSESLMNVSPLFQPRHFRNDIIYQKPVRNFPGGEP